MYEDEVAKIFKKVGMSKKENKDLWEQCLEILDHQMSFASVNYGLSEARNKFWDEQIETLEEDLRNIKYKKEK